MTEPGRVRRRWRIVLIVCAVAVLAVLTVIVFSPVPVDRPIRESVAGALGTAQRHGLPSWITYNMVERAANVAMFVPVGAVAALILRRYPWVALGLCILGSGGIEVAQFLLLPGRRGSLVDVVTNALGATIGVAGVVLARWWACRTRRRVANRRAVSARTANPRSTRRSA